METPLKDRIRDEVERGTASNMLAESSEFLDDLSPQQRNEACRAGVAAIASLPWDTHTA